MHVSEVLEDLLAEQADLDRIVADIPADMWSLPTPSPGWSIADQIGHLAFFDEAAALAIADEEAFVAQRTALLAMLADPAHSASVDDATLGEFRALAPDDQLARWRDARGALAVAAVGLADDGRVEWFGPSMGAKSFLTARLMEAWAHGQDIVDTIVEHGVAVDRPDTDRLRHVAQLGVITRGWSYQLRRLEVPDTVVRVELDAPGGGTWVWGPPHATHSVTGPAGDFCRVVTQRRHLDDTTLSVVGDDAREWMQLAQAFAGAPTDGPAAKAGH